jgi:hypothetical protein
VRAERGAGRHEIALTGAGDHAIGVGRRDRDRADEPAVGHLRARLRPEGRFIAEPPTEFLNLPYRQNTTQATMLVAQSTGDSAALAAPLRDVVRGLDVNMPIFNVRTMEQLYRMRAISIFNVLVGMVGAMGLMGLGLSIVGLYGLVAYSATRRTRETGIRMAIVAIAPTVRRMVLRQGVALAVIGLGVGLAASVGRRRALERGVSRRQR